MQSDSQASIANEHYRFLIASRRDIFSFTRTESVNIFPPLQFIRAILLYSLRRVIETSFKNIYLALLGIQRLLATYVELNYSPTNVKSFLDLVKTIHSLYFLDIRFSNLGLYNAFNGRQIKHLINVDEISRAGSGVTV
ncbi:MAG: hypothetical protein EXX96DRAFT_535556 [Benjaminiella poitrasii]|nr:MAG: hypothetical protein EXX96DRAFT_535556 [Benjaminiella poitrasii]